MGRSSPRRATEIRADSLAHRDQYVSTDGVDGHDYYGYPTLILTTIGRRTGRQVSTPLIYFRDRNGYVVVASFGGLPQHPNWLLNLKVNPEVEIQVGAEHRLAVARIAIGAERETLWVGATAVFPLYETYKSMTEREIPVVVLEPVDSEGPLNEGN
jgi:deazaflavin-dependent oxidoreductase (nitroreductase family)